MVIDDRVPRFASGATQVHTDEQDQGGEIDTAVRGAIAQVRRAGVTVLLMGGIGSGKTTFLKRFFSIVARRLVAPGGPAVLAMLDFLGAPDDPPSLGRFLWMNLEKRLRSQDPTLLTRQVLEQMCAGEITLIREAYGTGPESDKRLNDAIYEVGRNDERFSREALAYYVRSGRMPIVVFDNVDQLGIAAQTWIFTTAEHFANHLGCVSVLVMREESYCVAQLRKQLTAYAIRPYHLSSPGFREMIRIRIDFATRRAAELRDRRAQPWEAERHTREIIEFFEILRRSVFDRNRNIARLIEAVSFGNMRIALDLFNNFITSGATNTPEILARYRTAGGYSVPFHQFAKSVVLGDYRFYKQSRSLILNIFDVTETRNASHFTTLRMLRLIGGHWGPARAVEGFVDLQEVVSAMVDAFDDEEDAVRTIRRLIELGRQLLELDTRRTDSLDAAGSIRITSAGQYYLHYLANAFAYLDLVWHDTPIASEGISDRLAKMIQETTMSVRFERVEMFLDYLDEEEKRELSGRGLSREGAAFYGPFVPGIRRQYEREKAFIMGRVGMA